MHVNPTGRFVTGGPMGDAGLTGRKIIVDTYGGMARHGGGAFSGKDPTKVDRSARLRRPLGRQERRRGRAGRPLRDRGRLRDRDRPADQLSVESFGTGEIADERIQALIDRHFDLRPAAIIEALDLRRPIYRQTAAYGHFGRPDLDLPWERTDRAALLADDAGIGPSRSPSRRAERGARAGRRTAPRRRWSRRTPSAVRSGLLADPELVSRLWQIRDRIGRFQPAATVAIRARSTTRCLRGDPLSPSASDRTTIGATRFAS